MTTHCAIKSCAVACAAEVAHGPDAFWFRVRDVDTTAKETYAGQRPITFDAPGKVTEVCNNPPVKQNLFQVLIIPPFIHVSINLNERFSFIVFGVDYAHT